MQRVLGRSVTTGFALALVIWTSWFITHLPWVGLSGQAQTLIVLALWLVAATIMAGGKTSGGLLASICGNLTSALLGLLLLGSKLVEPAAENQAGAVKPNAALIALGFIALGGFIGALGFFVSRLLPAQKADRNPDWLARHGAVTSFIVAVLLFIGGLVTSTGSGMAVPDWPRTYGANMFLYPLSGAASDIFLEHTHRLFGTLVGLASITLLIWTFATEKRTWVKVIAGIVLGLVIAQGVIGGYRVNENSRFLAMLHGVLGQVTFGLIVAMAAILSPTFKAAKASEAVDKSRRLRFMTTGFLHATILQLIFGAMYRHYRDNHSLMAHIGFSIVVVLLAIMAAFCARAVRGEHGGIGPVLRRTGAWVVAVVAVQFVLGWIAFLVAGGEPKATEPGQALIRTAHQANGALLLALAVLGFVWTRRLLRLDQARAAA